MDAEAALVEDKEFNKVRMLFILLPRITPIKYFKCKIHYLFKWIELIK